MAESAHEHARNKVISVNGRDYRWPTRPVVAVCIDGSEPAYIEQAIAKNLAPNLDRLMRTGASLVADCVIPSFTNPNNISIITGRPPSVHGIAGNYFYDAEVGEEIMMNDVRFMRADTIVKAFHDAGAKVAVVTAKDKLRTLLAKGLNVSTGRAMVISAEKANAATKAENGVDDLPAFVGHPQPDVYSADLSEFVFAVGVKLLETFRPDLMYLSTTDFIQHTAAPGSDVANAFYAMIDRYVGALDALGCVLALTADHGMNDKHRADGEPDVLYLQDWFDAHLGKNKARVILPITDPYVVHHGALGSYATVHLPQDADRDAILAAMQGLDGVARALPRVEACARFELPPDRVGDIVLITTQHKVVGTSRARHDLSALTGPLRSHGGITEQKVPMIVNRKVALPAGYCLRNFDVFDVALNHAA